MPHDPDELAAAVVHNVANYMERELAPLRERLARLEAQPAARDGRDGMPGRDGDKGADGKDGRDGLDGKDGLGFDDLSVDYDGERTLTWKMEKGDTQKQFPVMASWLLDRGVWKADADYQRGDCVTWGGCLWVAQKATTGQPRDGDGGSRRQGWR